MGRKRTCDCADAYGPVRGTMGCPVHRQTVPTGKGSTIGNSGQAMMFAGRIAPAETRQHARYSPRDMLPFTVNVRRRSDGARHTFNVWARHASHAQSVARWQWQDQHNGQPPFDAYYRVTSVAPAAA